MTGDPQCWSFSRSGQRCGRKAGHDGDHAVVVRTEWSDEESWWPGVAAPVATVIDVRNEEDEPTGGCFSCGCSAAAHARSGGCASHSCVSFVA